VRQKFSATVANWFEAAQRILNVQGAMPQGIATDLQLGVNLLDLDQPEYKFLRRTARFSRASEVVAGASNATFEFVNPAGSGLIMVADILIGQNGAAAVSYGWNMATGAALGAGASAQNTDTRQPQGGALQGLPAAIVAQSNAVAFATIMRFTLGVGQSLTLPPLVVTPGFKVIVGSTLVAQAMSIQCTWTERSQTGQER